MKRETNIKGGKYLRDIILGFNDGLVSVFALITGVAGAAVSNRIVLLAGFAGLTAGAVSMALNNYISTKSKKEFISSQQKMEEEEIKTSPKEEEKEVEQIFKKKGFKGKILDKIVKTITSSKRIWIKTMMLEELKIPPKEEYKKPTLTALITGLAFIIGAIIPIMPYFFLSIIPALLTSIIISLIILFIVGAAKTTITQKRWFYSGIEMAFIGSAAALVSYFVGELFR